MDMNRRKFVLRIGAGALSAYFAAAAWPKHVLAALPSPIQSAKDPKNLSALEKAHVPLVKVPTIAEDGKNVQVEVTIDHPMEKDHYIESLAIYVPNDPVVAKGIFRFSPANGAARLKIQTRMNSGTTRVLAVATCNKHGRWVGEAGLRVIGGGC